jgi:hypothetical protein
MINTDERKIIKGAKIDLKKNKDARDKGKGYSGGKS